MNILRLPAEPAAPDSPANDSQLILLPGAFNRAADFVAAGFAESPADQPRRFDLVLPDIDLTLYPNGEAAALLHEQLIAPARAAGVRKIWLGGVSLGAFNSLCYAEKYPDQIDGLCLIAPWPGSRITQRLIAAAGGLEQWNPTTQDLEADAEQRVWHWLRQRRRSAGKLPIFIGWGADDRFAAGIETLANAMPDATVETLPGDHEWPVWTELWQRFCATGLLTRTKVALP